MDYGVETMDVWPSHNLAVGYYGDLLLYIIQGDLAALRRTILPLSGMVTALQVQTRICSMANEPHSHYEPH